MAIKLFEELVEDINKKGWIVLSLKQIGTVWTCHLQRTGKHVMFSPFADGKTPSEALRAAIFNIGTALKLDEQVGGAEILQRVDERLDALPSKGIKGKDGLTLMQATVLEKLIRALNTAVISMVEHGRTRGND